MKLFGLYLIGLSMSFPILQKPWNKIAYWSGSCRYDQLEAGETDKFSLVEREMSSDTEQAQLQRLLRFFDDLFSSDLLEFKR